MKQIKFLDLWQLHKPLSNKIIKSFSQNLKNSSFIMGDNVIQFENKFSKFNKSKFCVGVSSGTEALIIAMKSLGIGKGDEVITSAHTYISTVFAISLVGATPVLVDIHENSFNIDPKLIEKKINKRTKCILPVHMNGCPADMLTIMKIANNHKLRVIEDCSQSHGAKIGNKIVGNFGDVSAFSFYPGKNLGAFGDAGCMVTNKKKIYDKLFKLRNLGQKNTHSHEYIASNSRLDSIQASILSIKIDHLDSWTNKRIKIANKIKKKVINPKIQLPIIPKNFKCVYHLFVIRVKNRSSMINYLKQKNINFQFHYPKEIYKQKAYSNYKFGKFKHTSELYKEIISIPCHPTLKEKEVDYIIKTLNSF